MRKLLIFFASLAFVSAGVAQNAQQNSTDESAQVPAYQRPTPAQQQEIEQNLKDVHFAFDRFDLTPEDTQSLQSTANWLKANPEVFLTIAGDADERGSISYNLYLSDQRAKAVREALIRMGVPEQQIVFATGWGKLYPVCNGSDESCWSENRRAHFEPWQLGSFAAKSDATRAESARATLPDSDKP